MILLALLLACATSEADTCETMCRQLVQDCAYAAYPELDSCVQGCLYQEEQGADVEGEARCVEKAECDTFAIVECEHAFGGAD